MTSPWAGKSYEEAPEPVWMVAKIQYHDRRDEDYFVEVKEPVHFYTPWRNNSTGFDMSPAQYCAHIIGATRNIAATWDVCEVLLYTSTLDYVARLGAVDVTQEVKDAYDRIYVVRRHEFVRGF